MKLFLSNYNNKLDKKGRVSIPAQYRTIVVEQEFHGIVTYRSFINNCIESCGIDRIYKLSEYIDNLDPFSEERDAFATSILGGSIQLPFDGEGRVTIPEEYIEQLGLTEQVAFVGKGQTFEIWNPEEFKTYFEKASTLAKLKRESLRITGGKGA